MDTARVAAAPTLTEGSPAPGARAYSVLFASTLAFLVCFVVWMMFGVLGIQLREDLELNSTEFGLLTATPVLTGAAMRLPLGIWTDRFGGRIVMTVLLVACAIPVFIVSYATQLWQFLVIGLFLGCVGASFAVARPMSPGSSRRPGAALRWASSVPVPWAPPSICSSRRVCRRLTAGAWCRASTRSR